MDRRSLTMAVVREAAPPSPVATVETLLAGATAHALGAAIELNVFTAIGEGRDTAPEIAARCGAAPRGVAILCDYLSVHGFLAKERGRYTLSPSAAAFLDRRSGTYLGDAARFLLSHERLGALSRLADAVREGGNRRADAFVTPDNPAWVAFARGMGALVAPLAAHVAERLAIASLAAPRVLDVGAGHGEFGIAMARANPKATIDALDWAPVLDVARERAEAAGVAQRFRFLAGSAFEVPFDGPYDVVLFPSFLHHFDLVTMERFVARVRRALVPGGKAVTAEFVVNEDRVSPPSAAAFALEMLASTPAGDVLTAAQLRALFRDGGFAEPAIEAVSGTPFTVVVAQT